MKKATKITAEEFHPVSCIGHPDEGKTLCVEKKTSDHELVQSHDQLQKIMDQSLDVICTINEQGSFVKLGAASKVTWGYLSEELIGKQCIDLVHEEDREKTRLAFLSIINGSETNHFENRCTKKTGELVFITWSATWDNDDKIMYCVARDTTAIKKAEKKIREERMLLRSLMNILPINVYTKDLQERKTLSNRADYEYSGFTSEASVLGKSDFDLFDKESAERTHLEDQLVLTKGERIIGKEEQHIRKDGSRTWFFISKIPLLNEEKEIIGLMGISYDITKRKETEETIRIAKERYDVVVKATNEAVWDWDILTGRLYWGENYRTLFGFNPDQVISLESWSKQVHPDDVERVSKSVINAVRSPEVLQWEEEYRFIKSDGSVAYVLDRGFVIRNAGGEPSRMIGAMQDVTQKILAEVAIKELNVKLNRRAEELAASNDELEQFAYVASHDLQEPLRMISSFLQLLQKKYDTLLDETATQYIGQAVSGAERMKRLIMDLLEYSRVGTSRDKRTMTDMNAVMKQVMQIFANKINDTSAIVKVPVLPPMSVNKMQITQLFQNLVGNAFKYNHADKPAIEIGFEDKKSVWQFYIKDNGIGINPKYFEKVFIIFQRLHTRNEFSGTGIGLAICKKIVERHGGTIWVESAEGKGSTFYFTIKK
ncbi:MAG: PAS domain S-box protein [Chitinophagaceae bacterium]